MLAAIMEADHRVGIALTKALRDLDVRTLVADEFEQALRTLASAPRPDVLYVGEFVGPRPGPDLIAEIERMPQLAEVPTIAVLSAPRSLIADALRRGGMRVVTPSVTPGAIAALMVSVARPSAARRALVDRFGEHWTRVTMLLAGTDARRAVALAALQIIAAASFGSVDGS